MIGAIPFVMTALIVASIVIYVRFKSGRIFEPVFSDDFPSEFKPFMKMRRAAYRATANPRHTLLPILKRNLKHAKDSDTVECDIIGYKFGYEGYTQSDDWYKTIAEIAKNGGAMRLIGGKPTQDLSELLDFGAQIRTLDEPPETHIFICKRSKKSYFIWFELEHKDDIATCVTYTSAPAEVDIKRAKDYFNQLWESAVPLVAS
jgi:hypothetical protein